MSLYNGDTDPEISFYEVLQNLKSARLYLLFGALTGLLLGFIVTGVAVPHYRATALIGPAERGTGPDIKALLPENSSFAVQYLVNTLGTQDSMDFIRFEHSLRGPAVASLLLKDKKIQTGLKRDRNTHFQKPEPIDTPEKLSLYLDKRIKIEPVGTTPLRRLIYTHPDRDFASYLLQRLHETADSIIRGDIRKKTETRSAYLEKALSEILHPDHRRALTSLLMEQEHIRMILAIDEDFSASLIEPPTSGIRPSWPRKALIFPSAVLAGLLAGFAVYGLRKLS